MTTNAGTVSAVMTADPITVSARTPFKDIAELLTGNGIGAVGVLDKTGALVGVVSEADLLPGRPGRVETPRRGRMTSLGFRWDRSSRALLGALAGDGFWPETDVRIVRPEWAPTSWPARPCTRPGGPRLRLAGTAAAVVRRTGQVRGGSAPDSASLLPRSARSLEAREKTGVSRVGDEFRPSRGLCAPVPVPRAEPS